MVSPDSPPSQTPKPKATFWAWLRQTYADIDLSGKVDGWEMALWAFFFGALLLLIILALQTGSLSWSLGGLCFFTLLGIWAIRRFAAHR